MKKKLLLFSILLHFLSIVGFAQQGNLKSSLQRTRLFVELYNKGQYLQFYRLLDSSEQSRRAFSVFTTWMIDSLKKPLGQITAIDHLESTVNRQIFALKFERGAKRLSIQLDAFDAISAFEILPEISAPTKTVKGPLLHNNPLKSSLDSSVHKAALSYLELPQTCALSIGLLIDTKKIIYHYGEKSRGSAQLPENSSLFEAGSVTKTFTGLLLAQAITENKIKPGDDIREYLPGRYPDLAYGNTPITVMHLVNHSSGLPRLPANILAQENFDSLNPYKNYTEKMLFQDLRSLVIDLPPGTTCNYSNYGMAVLGKILEKVYKKSYSTLVKEKILDPLRMNNSCIDMSPLQEKKLLQGYNANGSDTKHWDLSVFQAAGALHTSAEDMLNFLEFQLLENDTACKLSHKITFDKNEKMAMAWHILSQKNKANLYWHNGLTYGFSSFCGFYPDTKLGIVILSNASASTDHTAIQILKTVSNVH